jgi:hypothetical protein
VRELDGLLGRCLVDEEGAPDECARCDPFQYLNPVHAEISALAESGNAVSAELLQRVGRELGAAAVSNAFVQSELNVL